TKLLNGERTEAARLPRKLDMPVRIKEALQCFADLLSQPRYQHPGVEDALAEPPLDPRASQQQLERDPGIPLGEPQELPTLAGNVFGIAEIADQPPKSVGVALRNAVQDRPPAGRKRPRFRVHGFSPRLRIKNDRTHRRIALLSRFGSAIGSSSHSPDTSFMPLASTSTVSPSREMTKPNEVQSSAVVFSTASRYFFVCRRRGMTG